MENWSTDSSDTARILLVDDDVRMARSLGGILENQGFDIDLAQNGEEALDKVRQFAFDAIILDIVIPKKDGIEVLKEIVRSFPALPVIMISGQGTIRQAVEATKLGAYDFLEKPLDAERVLVTLKNAIEQGRLKQRVNRLLKDSMERYRMVGESKALRHVFGLIERVAPTNGRVLIRGESGVGKELVARAIHHLSNRSTNLFVRLNCASMPDELIESALFGHRKGAFTGATEDKEGLFKIAHRGTLFLDEIGDMSLRAQSKVLRAIELGEIQRLGDSKTEQVDVRLIAATNQNLEELIEKGQFRQDLYYRLDVISLQIPPLRERKEDIPALLTHFSQYFSEEYNIRLKKFDPGAIAAFLNYDWPGNVRELRNVVEYLVIIEPSDVIRAPMVQKAIYRHLSKSGKELVLQMGLTLKEARRQFERELIQNRLTAFEWNVARTARDLGIDRTHLYKKMADYHLNPKSPRTP